MSDSAACCAQQESARGGAGLGRGATCSTCGRRALPPHELACAGEAVDRSLLKSVVELFLVMGVAATKVDFKNKLDVEAAARDRTTGTNETYINDFETPFISNSQAIYRTMSTDWLSADSIPAYLVKVEDTLTREKARVDAYLNPSTWTKLRAALVEVMLRDRAVAIREAPTGLADMLESDRREDIGRMYRLFSLWEGGSAPVAAGIARFVRTAGEAIVRKRATKLGAPDGKQYAGEARARQRRPRLAGASLPPSRDRSRRAAAAMAPACPTRSACHTRPSRSHPPPHSLAAPALQPRTTSSSRRSSHCRLGSTPLSRSAASLTRFSARRCRARST